MISETTVAQFSLTVSKSTGAGRADESTCYLCKLFRWWFPIRHRLSFSWPYLSQQGLRSLPNPRITFGRFLGDDFWVGREPVIVDYFWVNRGCWRWRIHASPLESVLLTISETVVAQFSFTVSKSIRDGRVDEPHVTFGSCFVDDFPVGTHSVFVDLLWVNRSCERFQNHVSPLEVF